MKKYLAMLFICTAAIMLVMTGCGAGKETQKQAEAEPSEDKTEETSEETEDDSEQTEAQTLEDLFGSDYVAYIVDTITMNMENRMDKTTEVEYYPVVENAPLTDYVTIDDNLTFEINENDEVVITFPAGTLTDEVHGEQSFILPRVYE